MALTSSDLPFLFVLYMVTEGNEILCINQSGVLILPCYEFEARYGSEAITTALARQMEKSMGYKGANGTISLADTEHHHEHESKGSTLAAFHDEDDADDEEFERLLHGIDPKPSPEEIVMRDDSPFRVCVAEGCVPCEKEPKDRTAAPFVVWARWAQIFGNDADFDTWDTERKMCAAQEKKIMSMPLERWNDMILSHEITHTISIMATKIAQTWIATVKPPSFPRKT